MLGVSFALLDPNEYPLFDRAPPNVLHKIFEKLRTEDLYALKQLNLLNLSCAIDDYKHKCETQISFVQPCRSPAWINFMWTHLEASNLMRLYTDAKKDQFISSGTYALIIDNTKVCEQKAAADALALATWDRCTDETDIDAGVPWSHIHQLLYQLRTEEAFTLIVDKIVRLCRHPLLTTRDLPAIALGAVPCYYDKVVTQFLVKFANLRTIQLKNVCLSGKCLVPMMRRRDLKMEFYFDEICNAQSHNFLAALARHTFRFGQRFTVTCTDQFWLPLYSSYSTVGWRIASIEFVDEYRALDTMYRYELVGTGPVEYSLVRDLELRAYELQWKAMRRSWLLPEDEGATQQQMKAWYCMFIGRDPDNNDAIMDCYAPRGLGQEMGYAFDYLVGWLLLQGLHLFAMIFLSVYESLE